MECNIQHAGVAGQIYEFLFLAYDMHAEPIAENLRLDCLEELGQILGVVLKGQELVDPRRQTLPLFLHVLLVGKCRAKKSFLMHFIGLNDNFDGITERRHHGGVERPVPVCFGMGDVVLDVMGE